MFFIIFSSLLHTLSLPCDLCFLLCIHQTTLSESNIGKTLQEFRTESLGIRLEVARSPTLPLSKRLISDQGGN